MTEDQNAMRKNVRRSSFKKYTHRTVYAIKYTTNNNHRVNVQSDLLYTWIPSNYHSNIKQNKNSYVKREFFSYIYVTDSHNEKSELILVRHARAYSSSCSQVILVYLHPFHCNSLFCSQRSPKNHQKPLLYGLRSFKVINDDITKKLVASACYDKQHVNAYLQPFLR